MSDIAKGTVEQRRDEVVKRMLTTPPKPHPKSEKKGSSSANGPDAKPET